MARLICFILLKLFAQQPASEEHFSSQKMTMPQQEKASGSKRLHDVAYKSAAHEPRIFPMNSMLHQCTHSNRCQAAMYHRLFMMLQLY
jgi:hypothetical protein